MNSMKERVEELTCRLADALATRRALRRRRSTRGWPLRPNPASSATCCPSGRRAGGRGRWPLAGLQARLGAAGSASCRPAERLAAESDVA